MIIEITATKILKRILGQYNISIGLYGVTFSYNNQNYYFACPTTWSDQDIIDEVKKMIGDPQGATYQVNYA